MGNPNQTELHRMFGTNVGSASHYKKNIELDPNGKLSVTYLDLWDRVIATALAGESSDNVQELESKSCETMTVSLNGNNVKGTGMDDLFDPFH